MRQPGTEYNVGSQAGVLWEMTTRADETPPPPNKKAQAQGETSSKQSMVGSSSLHSHLPDDTATHQPRQTHTPRSLLSTIRLPVPYCSPNFRIDFVVVGSLSFSILASCRRYTCNQATPCQSKRWCSVSSLLPMKPDEQSLCL